MALTAGTIYEIRATATTGNVNGAGFNPANAAALTDLTTDANTANTNSPVVSSASYNFAAGDVGAWLYIVLGTNWTPGWYQIASVASNKATLSAAVGQAIQRDTTLLPHKYYTNTVAGCATVGTPTNGTFLIDYSQQDTAQYAVGTATTSGAGSTTLTVGSGSFTRMMVGNLLYITSGTNFQTGWYEIVTFTDASNVVLDRTPTSGGAGSTGVIKVGGAGRLNGLEDAQLEAIPASSYYWIKNGTYTISGTLSIASTNSGANTQSQLIGYNSTRGDNPTGSSRPTIVAGANTCTFGQYQNLRYLQFTATSATGIVSGTGANMIYCKGVNTSTSTGRPALTVGTNACFYFCEGVSYNGTGGVGGSTTPQLYGCYFHDSDTCFSSSGSTVVADFNIFARGTTAGMTCSSSAASVRANYNTFYGRQAKMGTGLNLTSAGAPNNHVVGNIFYGLTTGVAVGTSSDQRNFGDLNVFYNNTNNTSNYTISQTDYTTLDPTFTSATEVTGTTATSSGSVLTQSGGDFSSVVDGVSYLFIVSGTGLTANRRYGIVSHTSTTITTDNSIGTSSAGDIVYWIGVGNNFAVGTNMKAISAPGTFPGAYTTGYLDAGAAQRQEGTGGGSVMVHIIGA